MTNSNSKGKRGEREASKELARLFGVAARRGVQYQGGEESPDVVADIPEVHFEVKREERFRVWEAVEQAVADAGHHVPVVLHRPNKRPWLAVVRLDDLPRLALLLSQVLFTNPSHGAITCSPSETSPPTNS